MARYETTQRVHRLRVDIWSRSPCLPAASHLSVGHWYWSPPSTWSAARSVRAIPPGAINLVHPTVRVSITCMVLFAVSLWHFCQYIARNALRPTPSCDLHAFRACHGVNQASGPIHPNSRCVVLSACTKHKRCSAPFCQPRRVRKPAPDDIGRGGSQVSLPASRGRPYRTPSAAAHLFQASPRSPRS